jgi:copper oxidase (laccase) domain-containing protein
MNVVEKSGGIAVYANEVVEVAYSGKEVGNVDPRFGSLEDITSNRNKLLQVVGAGKYTVQVCQLKAEFINLSNVPTDDIEPEYPTDGMFIDRPDVILGLNTADCHGMVFYNAQAPDILGLIHAGRQGIAGDIHLAALEHMTSTYSYGVPKEDVRIIFAPAIQKESYHFPQLPAEQLADPKWRAHIQQSPVGYHINLLGRVVDDLTNEGIDTSQMEISPIDVGTVGSPYFSHARAVRTSEAEGRNGLIAKLRPQ